MLKFMVVLYRRSDLTAEQFRRHLAQVHAPLAKKLPGLKHYKQNHVVPDAKRKFPGWGQSWNFISIASVVEEITLLP
jgi:uncharacterized protein (TIGR02118 family)